MRPDSISTDTGAQVAALLEVRDLRVHFQVGAGTIHAVNGVSFDLQAGETLAIVGESGCGKSTLAQALLRLHNSPPAVYPTGQVVFEGRDLLRRPEEDLRKIRGKDICMIFQDPMSSLNPVFTIGEQIAEAVLIHERVSRTEAWKRAAEALREVGIPNAEKNLTRYPHEYSGGMLQRAMIAMALAMKPRMLIADEPTTALDVTIQAQILELVGELQQKYGMAVIIITHDLGIVARIADRVLVMYAGQVVEAGGVDEIFAEPRMPYTWYLLNAIPRLGDAEDALRPIPGQPPGLMRPPAECPFRPRCGFAVQICTTAPPPPREVAPSHRIACYVDPRNGSWEASLEHAVGEIGA